MKRSKTSKAWMMEHVNDFYVQQAKAQGYRSRAAFKLLEIDDKDHLLRPGYVVIDLGAAPGGWSQIAARKVGASGRVVGVDLLEMTGVPGVTFLQGDFTEASILARIDEALEGKSPDVVLSDMAPNLSGIGVSDQARAMYLAELTLDFARDRLKPGGAYLVKVFQGVGYDAFLNDMRAVFKTVTTRKPKASRDRSTELFLLGRGLRA